jgi:nucleoside-diphosphate-sugar epimerase
MVHVSDLLDAIILAASSPIANRQAYIVTDNQSYTVRELYEWISNALEKRIPSWTIPMVALRAAAVVGDWISIAQGRRFLFDRAALEKLVEPAWFSSARIMSELNFSPQVDFKSTLPDMIAEYRGLRA